MWLKQYTPKQFFTFLGGGGQGLICENVYCEVSSVLPKNKRQPIP